MFSRFTCGKVVYDLSATNKDVQSVTNTVDDNAKEMIIPFFENNTKM